jgi:hypothetical protein
MSSRGERHEGGWYTGYEIGHSLNDLPSPHPDESDELMLVYNTENDHNCSSTFHIDYKDFFGIRSEDGWVVTMIPNKIEMEVFNEHLKNPAHVVILCDALETSDNSKRVSVADIASNGISVTLNGGMVHQVLNLKLYSGDSQCYMLYGHHSFLWPNKNRQFKLGIKVNTEGMLHLSSVIII